MSTTYLKLDNVSRRIDNFELGPISVDIEPGLVYAVVGPNGSGKSTLFRMIMGLVEPGSGSITRFDQPLDVDNRRQTGRIAFVPESLLGHESWTINQLAEIYQRSYPGFDSTLIAPLDGSIDRDKSFHGLSKGQQRRAMLSLAMATNSDLMLFDEPTDGLDPFARQDLLAEFSQLLEDGSRSIVMATHNLEDVRRIADVVVLLHNGRHIGTWNKDDVLEGWHRITLATAPNLPLDGEVSRAVGAAVQIVTRDVAATRSHLQALGISIIQQQSVDMVESLRILLDQEDSGTGEDIQNIEMAQYS